MAPNPITVRPQGVFPPGTSVSAYPLTEAIEYARRIGSAQPISTTAEDTAKVNSDGLVLLDVEAGKYALVGTVDGKRRSLVFTTYGEGEMGDTAPTNEIQQITVTATGGTFTASFRGSATGALAYNITAADLKTALEGTASIDTDDVTVTLNAGVYTITFVGQYEGVNVEQIVVDGALATGGTVTIATTQQGGA